jgi:predicted nucleic acid-binding protein
MKQLFDTSALVAAIWAEHPQHSIALACLQRVRRGEITGAISQHTLFEAYAALTGMPSKPRLGPALVRSAILEAVAGFEIVELTSRDYFACLERAATSDLAGGVIYDFLILHSAEKAEAAQLLTANVKDFKRLPVNSGLVVVGLPS